MQLGMVGLGRMGSDMTKRLARDGHEVKTYDPKVESTAETLAELAKQLETPRRVLDDGAGRRDHREHVPEAARASLEPGDMIVDGGNSNFRDSQRRYKEAREREGLASSTSASRAASGGSRSASA